MSLQSGRQRTRPGLKFLGALLPDRFVDFVNVDAHSGILEKKHGQLTSKVLAKLLETIEDPAATFAITQFKSLVPDREFEPFDQTQNPLGDLFIQQTNLGRIKSIQSHSD